MEIEVLRIGQRVVEMTELQLMLHLLQGHLELKKSI